MIFCIENDFAKYFAKCRDLFECFVSHTMIIFRNDPFPYYKANHPLDGTHLVAVRGLTTKRYSTQERQREELVGAALLHPIRTNRSSLTCRCQFPDSR